MERHLTSPRPCHQAEHGSSVALTKIDAEILSKNPASQILQHSKRIKLHDQMGYIPRMWGCFNIQKLNTVIHHINRMKREKGNLFWCRKGFWKSSHLIMMKRLSKGEIERNVFSKFERIYERPTTDIVFNGESLKAYLLRPRARRGRSYSLLLLKLCWKF